MFTTPEWVLIGLVAFIVIATLIKGYFECKADGGAKPSKTRKFGRFPWS
jgi:hypothetical protein